MRAHHGSGRQRPPGIAAGGDIAEEVEGPRLVAALPARASEGQDPLGYFESIVKPVGCGVRLTEIPKEDRLWGPEFHGFNGSQRVLQQGDAVGGPPRKRVGVAQGPRVLQYKEGEVPLATHCQPAFEEANGLTGISPDDVHTGQSPQCPG